LLYSHPQRAVQDRISLRHNHLLVYNTHQRTVTAKKTDSALPSEVESLEKKITQLKLLLQQVQQKEEQMEKEGPTNSLVKGLIKPNTKLGPVEEMEEILKSTQSRRDLGSLKLKLRRDILHNTSALNDSSGKLQQKQISTNASLSTSKTNYIDPRIVVAWCKRLSVPLEKIFTKSLQEKFPWAYDVDPDFVF